MEEENRSQEEVEQQRELTEDTDSEHSSEQNSEFNAPNLVDADPPFPSEVASVTEDINSANDIAEITAEITA